MNVEDTIAHESAHAAAAAVLGVGVHSVCLEPGGGGTTCYFGRGSDPAKRAIITLAGCLESEPDLDSVLRWPIEINVGMRELRYDRQVLQEITRQHHVDRKGYSELVQAAVKMAGQTDFQRMMTVLCTALAERPYLDANQFALLQNLAEKSTRVLEDKTVDTRWLITPEPYGQRVLGERDRAIARRATEADLERRLNRIEKAVRSLSPEYRRARAETLGLWRLPGPGQAPGLTICELMGAVNLREPL